MSSQRSWPRRTNSIKLFRRTSIAVASSPLTISASDRSMSLSRLSRSANSCSIDRLFSSTGTSRSRRACWRVRSSSTRDCRSPPISLRLSCTCVDAFRVGQPLRDRTDGAFRIGAGEVMHRRVGVDLRLGQFAHALAHAAEALLKRVVGAALAQQGVGEPKRRGDQRQWNKNDQEPGKLLRQWLGAEGFEQCGHILRLVHDDEPDRKHKQDNAKSDELRHQKTQPRPTNVVSFGTTGARLAQAQAGV